MFNIFKRNPTKKLRIQHAKLLEKAVNAQRKGDIELYSNLSKEAEDLMDKIEELEKASSDLN